MKDQQVKIYGEGDHAQVVQYILEENNFRVSVITPKDFQNHIVNGGVASSRDSKENKTAGTNSIPWVIAIRDNEERARISRRLTGVDFCTIAHPSAVIAPDVLPENGTVISARSVIQPNTRIGRHVIINTGAVIGSSAIIDNYVHVGPKSTITERVSIGEGSQIGAGAIIIPGIKIGKWCTIGAGAVVIKDIPDHATVVGNPGRIIKRDPPKITAGKQEERITYDIAFVGAGISTAYTLLRFLEKPHNRPSPVKIAVIEKNTEFFTGIPYGKRSGFSTLMLSPLKDLLPEIELKLFTDWLNLNKDWLLKRLSEDGGIRTDEWINRNKKKIDKGKWSSLFIPRSFFGYFIQERLKNAIEKAEHLDKVQISLIRDEIVHMDSPVKEYALKGRSTTVHARKVVLAIGAPRQTKLYTVNESKNIRGKSLVISNPYDQGMDQTIKSILHYVSKPNQRKPNVILLGANATALELLYKMNDLQGIDSRIDKYFLLSKHSVTPGRIEIEEKDLYFTPKHTLALRSVKNLTAEIIADAVNKDLSDAEALDIGKHISGNPISKAFQPLVLKLNAEEKEKFACLYGNDIGRRQRIAGCHYTGIVDQLKNENRLIHLKGTFENLVNTGNDALSIRYSVTEEGEKKSSELQADLIINCLGSIKLSDPQAPPIIKELIKNNKVRINASQRGLSVNQNLEILPGVHLLGPLLTGNVIEGEPIWHAENCGKVLELANILAERLKAPIMPSEDNRFQLKVHPLKSEQDILSYKKLLVQYDNHPYYRLEYFAHHRKTEGDLIILELCDEKGSLCIMPVLKRRIDSDLKPGYHDVITPYGYSGPLYQPRANIQSKQQFWELLKSWYEKENIVSEFIRFNHLNNHEGYNGELIATLKNVKGRILDDQNEQWKKFRSKVRNNYRKAEEDQLQFETFTGEDISEFHINDFHRIYIETMDRNQASSSYFFDLEYFQDLILSDPGSFILAFATKNSVIVSAELIIIHKDSMFAYLGGTRQDYFASRPNDFLRVNIIEMGRQKGFSWYILGGGMKDFDGLYKSKKYLFPNDSDFTFYTGRKIVNAEIYASLCLEQEVDMYCSNSFFPHYRSLPKFYKIK